jgi:WD40 repeat protein
MEKAKSSLREIFADAAEIADPAARAAFLDEACADDHALRTRIERLLAADKGAGHFLRGSGDTTTTALVSEKPGDRIGRYRLLERIGKGGGGVVYLAQQEEPVRRPVALKILKLGMDTQSVIARFEAERQALALMDHPNIARVLDAGATETGRPFFVMELVSGQKLSEYCDRHQLSLRQRLELFIPVCSAVQHAHQKGIVHRDLKPSNILVTEHEGAAVPKVIDFGIAKAITPGLESGLTSMNLFLGTPAYMSPEQVEFGARDIDTRTDIYSLGVILYELVAGQPPFDPKELAVGGLDEMRRIIREVDPPRPSTSITKNLNRAGLPYPRQTPREGLAAVKGDLDWIVMKCLEKDRSRRYETANALAMDIRRHLDDEPVAARPPTQFYRLQKIARRYRLAFVAAGVVALVLIGAVIVSSLLALRARRAEREQGRLRELAEAKADESRQHLIRRYVAEGNQWLEEGRQALALPWMVEALALEQGDPQREGDERLRIAQALVGAPELRLQIFQGQSINCIALSPDARRVATGSDDGVVRILDIVRAYDVATNLLMATGVGHVEFSPDGARVLAMDMAGRARVWNADTGEALAPVMQADDFDASSIANGWLKPSASFSPDGKLLLLACGSKSAQLRDAGSGSVVHELTHGQMVYHAAFSPDGRQVVTSSKDGTARVWDVATGKPAGPPLEHGGMVAWAEFSSDGSKLLTVLERHRVQLWDWREGRRLGREIPRRSTLSHASLSRDGSMILTTAQSGYAHVYDAVSGRLMFQFQQQGGLVDAAFSPDGWHVATACEDGNAWIWDPANATSHPLALPHGNHIKQIAFSRNGRLLAVAGRGGHARVWDLAPQERGVRRLPGHDVTWAEFDRSGHRALVLSTGQKSGVDLYDAKTGKLLRAITLGSGGITQARFSPDGHRILAFGTGSKVLVLDADTGKELLAPLVANGRMSDAFWSPDGKLIFATTRQPGAWAWDSETGTPALTFLQSNSVTEIAISPDGERLATDNAANEVLIWELPTERQLAEPLRMAGPIHQLRFSPDGKRLAIASSRGTEIVVELRDVTSGQLVGGPLVHRDAVRSMEFSKDGRWLATACDDHTARVWNAATGEPVSPWLPHDYEARLVAFSPDSAKLATLARRGAVRLWNTRSGEPITAPLNYPRNLGSGHVSYSPDGLRLLLCRGGNEAWIRELQPTTESLETLRLQAEVLSCTRFDPAAGMVPISETDLKEAWNKLRALHVTTAGEDRKLTLLP